jgi:hypothetical protein
MSHQSTRGAWNSHVTSTSPIGARTVHVRCSFWPSTIIWVQLPTQMSTGICRVTLFPRIEQLYLSSNSEANSTTKAEIYCQLIKLTTLVSIIRLWNVCYEAYRDDGLLCGCWIRQRWVVFFFLGMRLGPLGTSATVGLLYQPRMIDDDYGAVGGMRIGRGNRSTGGKPAPVSLCPPQIPHDLTWDRTGPP